MHIKSRCAHISNKQDPYKYYEGSVQTTCLSPNQARRPGKLSESIKENFVSREGITRCNSRFRVLYRVEQNRNIQL
jgi:hypothetical protein